MIVLDVFTTIKINGERRSRSFNALTENLDEASIKDAILKKLRIPEKYSLITDEIRINERKIMYVAEFESSTQKII